MKIFQLNVLVQIGLLDFSATSDLPKVLPEELPEAPPEALLELLPVCVVHSLIGSTSRFSLRRSVVFSFAGVHIECTMDSGRMVVYSAAELYAIYRHDFRLPRLVRKFNISHRLWLPARQRARSQRLMRARYHSSQLIHSSSPSLDCVNARSVGNKSSLLCRSMEERQFDVLVVVETWYECSESAALKHIVPPGYQSIDAARPMPPDVRTDTFQNHGGLAFICRQATVRVQKRLLNVTVTTFEYLCGYVSTTVSHFLLLGIYRPDSQLVTSVFFDELSSVFEQLATYRCPVVVCGDFKIHVDQTQDAHAERLSRLLQSFDSTVGNMSLIRPTLVDIHLIWSSHARTRLSVICVLVIWSLTML